MNLTRIIDIKERIAISPEWKPDERDFILECINTAIGEHIREAAAEKLAAPNYLGRIEMLWGAFSIDEGGEGLCAAPLGQFESLPLIAADPTRLNIIRPIAQRIAKMFRKPVRIAKFTKREDVEIFQP